MSQSAPRPYQNGPYDPLYGGNHLTLIRLILASMVVFCHLGTFAKGGTSPDFFALKMGDLAVNGFFILSGLLIAKSLHAQSGLTAYARSRALRILPALAVVTVSLPLFFAPLFSPQGGVSELYKAENWQYVVRVLTLGDPVTTPGDVFATNRNTDFNNPLWTVRIEILAYIGAAFIYYTGLARTPARVLWLTLGISAAYLVAFNVPNMPGPASLVELLRLGTCFLIGQLLFYFPRLRQLGWRGAGVGIALWLLLGPTFVGPVCANLAVAGVVLAAGLPRRASTRVQKIPDYSYGVYIWHAPILQSVLFLLPDLGPGPLLVVSAPFILICAAASWHGIERPALNWKKPSRAAWALRRIGQPSKVS